MSTSFVDRRVVVTGGAGFLGHYVVEGLQQRGCQQILVPRIEEYDLVNSSDIERIYETMRLGGCLHSAFLLTRTLRVWPDEEEAGSIFARWAARSYRNNRKRLSGPQGEMDLEL